MKKAPIYTRTGDKGTTALVGGTRLKKSDPRIHLYGEVDELNSTIGLALSFLNESFDKSFLQKIQSSLFDLGSNLACENEKRAHFKLPQLEEGLIVELEKEIDKISQQLPLLRHFILPGGTSASACFHVCRTVCRRVERQMVEFGNTHAEEVPERALEYINRLSDYFFMLSRLLNFMEKKEETQWTPS